MIYFWIYLIGLVITFIVFMTSDLHTYATESRRSSIPDVWSPLAHSLVWPFVCIYLAITLIYMLVETIQEVHKKRHDKKVGQELNKKMESMNNAK